MLFVLGFVASGVVGLAIGVGACASRIVSCVAGAVAPCAFHGVVVVAWACCPFFVSPVLVGLSIGAAAWASQIVSCVSGAVAPCAAYGLAVVTWVTCPSSW